MQGPALPAFPIPPLQLQITPEPAQTVWRCNCVKYCKGVLRQISKRQYHRHAAAQTHPEDVLAQFQPILPAGGPQLAPFAPGPLIFNPHARVRDMPDDPDMPELVDSDSDNSDGDEPVRRGRAASLPPARASVSVSPERDGSPDAHNIFYPPGVGDGKDDGPRPQTPPADPEFGYTEEVGTPRESRRKEVREAHAFIRSLKSARLEDSGLSEEAIARMLAPRRDPASNVIAHEWAGLHMFCARGDASEENYADNRAAFMELTDEPIPTYEQVKRLVSDLTGIDAIHTDMCPNTCVAYVGPFAAYEQCPFCGESCYNVWKLVQGKRVPHCTFQTYPLGPQLQAMWSSPKNAALMKHHAQETARVIEAARLEPDAIPDFNDVYYGEAYLNAVQNTDRAQAIHDEDMVLMYLTKHFVLPGAVIGGPRKLKNVDSFIFPGLYHLAALQRTGLSIWDASEGRLFTSYLFLLLATADGPGMAYLNGLVGHQGAHGCHLYCPFPGRNKPGMSMYYPAARCPLPRIATDHDNLSIWAAPDPMAPSTRDRYEANLRLIEALTSNAIYAHNRLQTGIAKPTIFSGLTRTLGVPDIFGAELMHLITLNITDLVLGLLHGSLTCDAPDNKADWTWAIFADKDVWVAHGKLVAEATRCLPGSFDRPLRNPTEKISSGYKAWEYLLYVYGLLPGLLRGIQQPLYLRHFCKLVSAVRTVLQRRLPADQLVDAHRNFIEYADGMELLYYARRRERLHFLHQSVHATTHIVPEVARLGPGSLYTQWTLENYIGNITREIKQHSTPYANVSKRALRRSQVNALKAMIPALDNIPPLPRGSQDLGGGFTLLHALDTSLHRVTLAEADAILSFLVRIGHPHPDWTPLVRRWARLKLPNGQIKRTAWKECLLETCGRLPRRAHMVKLIGRPSRFTEVQFFFVLEIAGMTHALAMIAPFSEPDPTIFAESENTVIACTYPGEDARHVVEVTVIASVVVMVPLPLTPAEAASPDAQAVFGGRYFVVEKPGLDVAFLAGHEENFQDDDN
ncbi:hypothetical protein C2E23DRAFT_883119 [Lenzites betulinus]|nr:hypothetical protein C2E23DRAFT_883119 [Lenzites betulinus]